MATVVFKDECRYSNLQNACLLFSRLKLDIRKYFKSTNAQCASSMTQSKQSHTFLFSDTKRDCASSALQSGFLEIGKFSAYMSLLTLHFGYPFSAFWSSLIRLKCFLLSLILDFEGTISSALEQSYCFLVLSVLYH